MSRALMRGCVLVAALLSGLVLRAESQSRPARSAAGRLAIARGGKQVARAGQWVTLHRVGRDAAGPLDSTRTAADGHFAFTYKPSGDSGAVYFVSSQYGGVAYYSPPLGATVPAGGADIVVYDTSSGPVSVAIASHHVIVSAPDSAESRVVVEVFVIENSGEVTRVPGAGGTPVFTTALPAGARGARTAGGDFTPEAVSFTGGQLRVVAPIVPGTRKLAISYRVPLGTTPFNLGTSLPADVMEVLVEDSAGVATGGGLHEDSPTSISGRSFRRFIGAHIADAAQVRILAPTGAGRGGIDPVAAIVIAAALAMVASLGFALRGPAQGGTPSLAPPPDAA